MRASTILPRHENWPCHTGECQAIATHSHDNGDGGDFLLCDEHQKEFEAMEAWLNRDDANAGKLAAAIKQVE